MGQFPTKEEVLAAATKAGWLLEQQAVRVLKSRGFSPRPSWAFQDPDAPTVSRELDVWSYRDYFVDEANKVIVAASVLVECKQSENPFCAIGHELPEWRRKGNPAEHTLPVKNLPVGFDAGDPRNLLHEYAWDVMGFRSAAIRFGQTNFRATQLTRLDRANNGWSATNSDIFNNLVFPLAKAVQRSQRGYGTESYWPLPNNQRQDQGHSWTSYILRFPVVLISSTLHVIDAGGEKPLLSEQKWVRVQRHLESESVKGLFEFDVVTKDAFIDYIKTVVEGLTMHVAMTVKQDIQRFKGEEHWMKLPGTDTQPPRIRRVPPPSAIGSPHRAR
ncbi:MAG: hypothetical protein EKK34_25190 [Mycobacterium sp.]|nr:MAG: hypothetical protein EKK34_25190 [Mycobacterium sp.]